MILTTTRIRQDLKRCDSISFFDSCYVLPRYDYVIREFLPWFKSHLYSRGMLYSGERFDCDDFAKEFSSKLVEAGLRIKERAAIAVATMTVNNIEPAFGIPIGKHALNLVGVNYQEKAKWLVIEPQNQQYAFIQDYLCANNLVVSF
jgi:hypothetical protein